MAYTFLWFDGFDEQGNSSEKYSPYAETNSAGQNTSTTPTPPYGYGRSLRLNGSGEVTVQKVLPGAPFTAMFIGFHVRIDFTDSTERTFLQFWDYTDNLIQIELRRIYDSASASYIFRLYRGATLIATSSPGVPPASWAWISVRYVCDPTSGTFDLQLNGSPVLSFSGNTRNGSVSRVHRPLIRTGVAVSDFFIDNLVIASGLPSDPVLPECRIYGATVPNANFGTPGFTPSSGSNWSNVSEVPPNDDTSYNHSNVVGAQDLFTASMPSLTGVVYAVKANFRSRKEEAGARTLAPVIRPGSTDYPGSDVYISPNYFTNGTIWQQNPDTSLPWTPSDISGLRFGYRITS